jgi:hypothetical protein
MRGERDELGVDIVAVVVYTVYVSRLIIVAVDSFRERAVFDLDVVDCFKG